MTALAQEWAPGYITPGARPFENTYADLELVGVHLTPEQLDLGERAARFRPGWWDKMYCLTLVALPDPVFPHSAALGLHAFTLDEDGAQAPVVVPVIAEIDCSEWESFDEREPNWRRFPSLLGRRQIYHAQSGLMLDEGLEPLRLWHCWPIEEHDVAMVKQALEEWVLEQWLPYTTWLEVRDNDDTSVCEGYLQATGCLEQHHQHEYDERGDIVVCRDGESWFEYYGEHYLLLDDDGDLYPRPFAPVGGLHHLTEVWTNLLSSSQANTRAALEAYPQWDQDDVARTERHYSPWLWSS